MQNTTIVRLADRLDIGEIYQRYAQAVDRRDWKRLRACFHGEARLNHLAYQGDVEGFIEWLIPRHELILISVHFIGNSVIEFVDDNTAFVETYGLVFLRISAQASDHKRALLGEEAPDGDVESEELVRYADRFEKRDGTWRIARQHLISDARRSRIAGPQAWSLANFGFGLRNDKDNFYGVRRELGLAD